jgi:superfamily II DNA or RNA helicase
MTRTLRSKRDRALLWYAAGGICPRCGKPLGEDWEADHIVPWIVSQRTNVHEMQALCATCNREKGAMSYRQHQREFERVCRDILAGTNIRRIVMSVTPGGGKSLLPQIAAHILIPKIADKVCWIVPRDALREQGTRNFIGHRDRQLIGHSLEVRATTKEPDPSHGTAGFITTYHALSDDPEFYTKEFDRYRYILILDEPHHLFVDDEKKWAKGVAPLIERAHLLIQMSGTWDRPARIAFIDYTQTTDGLWMPDIPNRFEIRGTTAYIRYSRQMAIQERAIKELRMYSADGMFEYINRNGQTTFVPSFATAGNGVRDAIFTALRTDFATRLIDKWAGDYIGFRQHRKWAKAIAIAPNINLARQYLKYVTGHYATIRADIAVSKTEEGNPDPGKAKENILRFKRKYTEPDALDLLVTVAMAYEGLDVPEITHLAFLTHIRERSWVEQAVARAARVSEYAEYNEQFGHVYGPDDALLNEVMARIIAEQEQGIKDRVDEPTPPGPNGTAKDPPTVVSPQRGVLTRERATDLTEGAGLTFEETGHLSSVLVEMGLRGIVDPITYKEMVLRAQQPRSPAPTPEMPALTVNQREAKLSTDIESYAARVDYHYGWTPPTCNGLVKRHFRKSREGMNEAELLEVWKWLTATYPV